MPERYQVPKNEITARVLLADGSTAELQLYVSDRAQHHAGRERASDLLNGDEAFFPVNVSGTGFALLRRTTVLVMTVAVEAELIGGATDGADLLEEGEPAAEGAERVDVRVVLDEGTEVDGTVAYLMPPGERRLQDFLNQAGRFFPVRDGDDVHLVNTERVVQVVPM